MQQEQPFNVAVLPSRGHNAVVDAAREMAEVKVQVMLAVENPRVRSACVAEIIEQCRDYDFATQAMFRIERGGKKINDGSIKLALVMAQNWGNLDCGVRELERTAEESVVESYCWDLQKNFRQRRRFVVPHRMKANGTIKTLTDPNDVYFMIANMGARRMRSCIFDVIPADVKVLAIAEVGRTLARGKPLADGKSYEPIAARVQRMVIHFKSVGVSVEMLEQRLGHKIDLTVGEELVDLQAVYNSIKDGGEKRAKFFKFPKDEAAAEGKAAELRQKIRGGAAPASTDGDDDGIPPLPSEDDEGTETE